MASEGPREPVGEGIKLSADVKPFVPKFAGLSVAWSESSEARVFPRCAATYYPCVQELPVPEQKLYTEDVAFGASTFPPQYLSSELALHPCGYFPYPADCPQGICPVPGSPHAYGHPGARRTFQTARPRGEQMCPLPQDTKAVFKKKTYDEQKFDSKKADGSLSSDIKPVRGSHPLSIHADTNVKPGENDALLDVLSSFPFPRNVTVLCTPVSAEAIGLWWDPGALSTPGGTCRGELWAVP